MINVFFLSIMLLLLFFVDLLTLHSQMEKEHKSNKKLIIGASDIIDLPSLRLYNISCKIDTGADTSAIHTHRVEVIEKDQIEILQFRVLDPSHPLYTKRLFRFRNFLKTRIRNSFGEEEERFVIKTKVQVFGQVFYTEFTLANRQEMRYPILLGKKFLENRFLVDVGLKNASYIHKKAIEEQK